MPGLALDAIRRSYGRARLRRQPWEPLWRECYAYALPQRGYGLGAEFGQARRYNETLFDGTAPDAVDQLSSFGDERTRWGSALAVEGLDGLVDGDVEGVGVAEGAVGEVVALQVAPGPLDVVQLCALRRCTGSVGASPTRQLSLQPEAPGADQEVTNGLKNLGKRPLSGASGPSGPRPFLAWVAGQLAAEGVRVLALVWPEFAVCRQRLEIAP